MTATCPACGGESMLRGRCVLPWCSSWDEAATEHGWREPLAEVSSFVREIKRTAEDMAALYQRPEDEKGAEEPRKGPLAGEDRSSKVVGPTEGEA